MEPHRLGKQMADEIENPETELWLSPVSIWEVVNLSRKNRLDLFQNVDAWTSQALRSLTVKEAALTIEVMRELGRMQLSHRDPADNFLVATAKVFELTLATRDELLLETKEIEVLRA